MGISKQLARVPAAVWVGLVILAALTPFVLASLVATSLVPSRLEEDRLREAERRMQVIVGYLRKIRERDGAWPRSQGKEFVLEVVRSGYVGVNDRRSVDVLFSPSDPIYSADAVDLGALQAYAAQGLGVVDRRQIQEFTSFLGRRFSEAPSDDDQVEGGPRTPLLADVTSTVCILVAYADGTVRRFTYAEWGIDIGRRPPWDLPVGTETENPLLRRFSR